MAATAATPGYSTEANTNTFDFAQLKGVAGERSAAKIMQECCLRPLTYTALLRVRAKS